MLILFILFLLITENAMALDSPVVTITTGYAYITCSGVNTGQIELPIGSKYMPDPGCFLTEVPDQKTLDSMTFTPPASSTGSAQQQLNALRDQTLNTIADAQIASNPALQSTASTLKLQGAK